MSPPRLVIAGNLLVDDLVFADGQTRMGEAGGAVLYAALSASLWSRGIACLSRRGDDYPDSALQALAERGVDLQGVRPLGMPGGRTWLLYEGTQWRMVPRQSSPSHEAVSPTPEDIPAEWRAARAVHLAPMPLASQEALLAGWSADAFISLDPHLPIREDTLLRWQPLLARIDALFLGESELALDGLEARPHEALRRLRSSSGRLRYVAWKRGAAGGLLYDARLDQLIPWAARATSVVDPTGCGDALAAAFATAILDGEDGPGAIQRGVAAASFALSGWASSSLMSATPAQAQGRLRDFSK